MNFKVSVNHNLKCWKTELKGLDEKINFLKGKKRKLEEVIECLEIINEEQKQ